ncbi:hypothetical protein CSKR_100054 [Clonorchis sinensis]|uniref:Uncharacterized protein n=1 Tax=Clonorchis sinensis TaxID=79923 RepID=A0A3R7F4N6_CLOSI|nr:hypothetical protein CSKR_100054 [Clonorchis sinensis]
MDRPLSCETHSQTLPDEPRGGDNQRVSSQARILLPGDLGQHELLHILRRRARWSEWLEREFTGRKVCVSNPTSASRLPLSRLGQPGSIPAFVLPSGGMAVRHRKGATVERFFRFTFCRGRLWIARGAQPERADIEEGRIYWALRLED